MSDSDFESEHDTDSENDDDIKSEHKSQEGVSNSSDNVKDNVDCSLTGWQQQLMPNEDGSFTYTDPNSGLIYQWDPESQEWVNKSGETTNRNFEIDKKFEDCESETTKVSFETSEELNAWQQGLTQSKDGKYTYTNPKDGSVYEWDSVRQTWCSINSQSKSNTNSIDSDPTSLPNTASDQSGSETSDVLEDLKSQVHQAQGTHNLEPWQEYLAANEGKKAESITCTDPSDGTVYEWDKEQKAWFPKVLIINSIHKLFLLKTKGSIQNENRKYMEILFYLMYMLCQ